MRSRYWLFALVVLVQWVPLTAFSEVPLPARPQYHVNDYAHVLDPEAFAGLEQKFTAFEAKTGHQAAVAIFPDIGGAPIEDFTNKLFSKWRLGKEKKDDGILLVLAVHEHALRIEVGYGLEGQLPDALAGRIIRQEMIPYLKEGQAGAAILVFEKRLEDIFVDGKNLASPPARKEHPLITLVIVFGLMALLYSLFFSQGRGRTIGSAGVYNRSTWWWWLGGGGGGGGGWGGGGGSGWGGGGGGWGGGGGGMSGGGGASGSW